MNPENNQLIGKMVDDCMKIMRGCSLFVDISEDAWEKANEIQENINGVKHHILELEKMIR